MKIVRRFILKGKESMIDHVKSVNEHVAFIDGHFAKE